MITKDFRKRALSAGSALQVLALIGAGLTVAGITAAPAAAQDYTSGSISGSVTDESGSPVVGATVTITSNAQGVEHSATTGSSGSFRFPGLSAGAYTLNVTASGKDGFTANDVIVAASQTADVNIGLTTTGNEIVVTGAAIVSDFSGTTTGINVDVAELTKTVPVGQNLTAVMLLAPSTSKGDSTFGNLASVGGSSVAENAYYINGLNITNFDNYLGSAEVPFYFYKSVEVKSGGYPAEFGRATGGIVNSVTKSGSNEFTGAIHLNWTPNALVEKGANLLNCETDDNDAVVCVNSTNRAAQTDNNLRTTLELGGPILKDRLFVYGLVELRDREYTSINRTAGSTYFYKNNDPFWGVKVDAYPIDGQHLEFTIFDTRNVLERRDGTYSEDSDGNAVIGAGAAPNLFYSGGVNYVGKYTGNLTDWFTVSAAYGRMQEIQPSLPSSVSPYVKNESGGSVNGVANNGFFTDQRVSSGTTPYELERKFYRADADAFFAFKGDHHVRFGFDTEKNTLAKSTITNGGAYLVGAGLESQAAFAAGLGGSGLRYSIAPDDAHGNAQVDVTLYVSGGTFNAKNTAFYIEDEWNVTDRLTLNLGARRDDFKVNSGDGSPLVTLKKNYAPRLGATYDLFPEQGGKLKAFYGWYYLPFASNTAYRNTGSEYYETQRFQYNGFNSAGIPLVTSAVTDDAEFPDACTLELIPGEGTAGCVVTSDGTPANAESYISKSLKATKEEEFILGYEQKVGEWNLGINYIHRSLMRTAEDVAIDAGVNAYCAANGINCNRPNGTAIFSGFRQYVIVNPGEDFSVLIHGCRTGYCTPLEGTVVELKAEDLGYPKPKRTTDAIEFTFDRPYDGKWSLGGSYTLSWNKGNTEGYVQSDYGQADAGITVDFDQPGFTYYADGYLPNDRRHRLKLYGAYTLFDKLTLGTNVSVDSPRHLSCFGFNPDDGFANQYGAYSHYCGGEPSVRGTAQKSDWITNVDLKASYNVDMGNGRLLTLRADVFNVFNSQSIQKRYEFGDLDADVASSTYVADPMYGQPTGYQSPRSIRLGVDIEF